MLKWCGVNHKYNEGTLPSLSLVLVQDAVISHLAAAPPLLCCTELECTGVECDFCNLSQSMNNNVNWSTSMHNIIICSCLLLK